MISIVTLVVLAVASYRLTRLLVLDSLFSHSRMRFHAWLANRKGIVAHKALEGLSCTWCSGVWISAGLYWLYRWESPQYWGRLGWISVAAIAGVQGMIHALEPEEA